MSVFKRRRFPVEVILLCVRWYCKYGISHRDLAEMMQERGVTVDGCSAKRWKLRSGFAGIRAIVRRPGGSMKPMCASVVHGNTCSVPSIRQVG